MSLAKALHGFQTTVRLTFLVSTHRKSRQSPSHRRARGRRSESRRSSMISSIETALCVCKKSFKFSIIQIYGSYTSNAFASCYLTPQHNVPFASALPIPQSFRSQPTSESTTRTSSREVREDQVELHHLRPLIWKGTLSHTNSPQRASDKMRSAKHKRAEN